MLAVTERPQIFSRSVSFEFSSSQALAKLRPLARGGKIPVLRAATLIDDPASRVAEDPILRDLCSWASTVVRLPDVSKTQRLHDEIETFRSEFLPVSYTHLDVYKRQIWGMGWRYGPGASRQTCSCCAARAPRR